MYNFGFLAVLLLFGGHVAQHLFCSPSKVTGFALSVVLVESGDLDGTHKEEDLKVGGPANSSGGTEDIGVSVGLSGEVDACLLDKDSNNGKHADTSVLQFGPTSVLQVGLNVRPVVFVGRLDGGKLGKRIIQYVVLTNLQLFLSRAR